MSRLVNSKLPLSDIFGCVKIEAATAIIRQIDLYRYQIVELCDDSKVDIDHVLCYKESVSCKLFSL